MGVNAAGVSAVNSVNYQYDAAAANIAIVDTVTGGSGNDTVLFTDGRQWTSGDIINLGAGVDTVTVMLGTSSTDALAAGSQTGLSNIENINFIVGGANTANAAIETADANFVGVDATINAAGVPGVMTIDAKAETDSSLTITGGTGADIITGGTNPTKVDTISGGLGNDTIKGGRGSDILTGGAGADIFVYTGSNESNTSTSDSIKDFVSGTDKFFITVDLSAKVSAQTYNTTLTTAKADVSAAQAALTGVPGQMLYVTGEESLYINDNADNLLTSLDYKIGINPAATATATVANGDFNIKITGAAAASNTLTTAGGADIIIGGSAADIITSGAGADIIISGAGADVIISGAGADTITSTTEADIITPGAGIDILIITGADAIDTIILADAELASADGTAGSVDADQVTGFVLGIGTDKVSIDISAIKAIPGVINFRMAGAGGIDVAAGAGSQQAGEADITTLSGNGVNILEVESGSRVAATLETRLEIGGIGALTNGGGFAAGDAFLVLSDDNIGSSLFLILVGGDGSANAGNFASGELTAIELIEFVNEPNAQDFHPNNLVFVD
jgi:serralysin